MKGGRSACPAILPEKRRRLIFMRRNRLSISMALLVTGAVTFGFAASQSSGVRITGSDLARRLAQTAREAGSAEASSMILRVDLGRLANAPATERTAAVLLNAAGLSVTSDSPDRLVSESRTRIMA